MHARHSNERKFTGSVEPPNRPLAERSEVDDIRAELQYVKQQMEILIESSGVPKESRRSINPQSWSRKEPDTNLNPYNPAADGPLELAALGTVSQHYASSAHDWKGESKKVKELEEQLARVQLALKHQAIENQRLQRAMQSLQHKNAELSQSKEDLKKQLTTARNCFQYHLGSGCMAAQIPAMPDSISIDDLKDKVEVLNAQILHAVGPLVETLTRRRHRDSLEMNGNVFNYIDQSLGKVITGLLTKERRLGSNIEPNRFLAQISCQVLLAKFCCVCIEQWCWKTPTLSGFLEELYLQIQRDNLKDLGAARRWRASARKSTKPDFQEKWYSEAVIIGLMNIFKVASWALPSEQQRRVFDERLKDVFETLRDLRSAMMEQIVSIDIYPSDVPSDTLFTMDGMDNAFEDSSAVIDSDSGHSSERVAGTIGLGLKKVIYGVCDEQGNVTYENILPPKVILNRTLLEATSIRRGSQMQCGKI